VAKPEPEPKPKPNAEHIASIRRLLESLESEKQLGQAIGIDRLTPHIAFDEIQRLPSDLIHRLHRLLVAPAPTEAPLRQTIIETVKDALKLRNLDPTTTFQSYGLDSISAMVVSTRLEKKLKRSVKAQWLMEHCTVEALTQRLSAS
jgi:acyl carrier protein